MISLALKLFAWGEAMPDRTQGPRKRRGTGEARGSAAVDFETRRLERVSGERNRSSYKAIDFETRREVRPGRPNRQNTVRIDPRRARANNRTAKKPDPLRGFIRGVWVWFKSAKRFLKRLWRRLPKRKVAVVAAAAAILISIVWMIGAAIGAATGINATEIIVSGTSVGIVPYPDLTPEDIETQLRSVIVAERGDIPIRITDTIRVSPLNASSRDTTSFSVILPRIRQSINFEFEAFELVVSGTVFAVVPTRSEAQSILDRVSEPHITADTLSWEFVEETVINPVFITDDMLTNPDDAVTALKRTVSTEHIYTIQSGDTLDAIALEFGITRERLLELNPGIEYQERSLQIGRPVTVEVQRPVLSVRTVSLENVTRINGTRLDAHEPDGFD